jgi:hypothetical protein
MSKSAKTIEFKFERTIPAPLGEVFDAWLNPKIPGNPWNMADKLLLNRFLLRGGRRPGGVAGLPLFVLSLAMSYWRHPRTPGGGETFSMHPPTSPPDSV